MSCVTNTVSGAQTGELPPTSSAVVPARGSTGTPTKSVAGGGAEEARNGRRCRELARLRMDPGPNTGDGGTSQTSSEVIPTKDGSAESPATSMMCCDEEGTSPSTFAYHISSEELLQYREKYARLRETWRANQAVREGRAMENPMVVSGSQAQVVKKDSPVIARRKTSGKILGKLHSSIPPIFRRQDFPSLAESISVWRRKKGLGPPFDKNCGNFSCAVKDENFPFREVEDDALTLKFALIKLCWLKRSNSLNNLGRRVVEEKNFSEEGQFREERWFRAPPKVRLIAGILGPCPGVGTRGIHPLGGEGKEVVDLESRHPPPGSRYLIRGGVDCLDHTNPKEIEMPKPSNLTRFVGHLWRGAPSKSFAAAVKTVTAPTVTVMQPHGEGRGGGFRMNRGGFGYNRGGFNRGTFGHNRGGFGGRGFGPNRGGGGRQGEGGGQMDLRPNLWKRKEETLAGGEQLKPVEEGAAGEDRQKQSQDSDLSNWEKSQEMPPEKQSSWGLQGAIATGEGDQKEIGKSTGLPRTNPQNQKLACENCGLFNHNTKDCKRSSCEICGLSNHSTFECKNCLAWNYGPELCATQVEDQSFFFIDELIDSRVAREKACTVVMTVVTGSVNAKQIEHEFMNLIGAASWRWIARPVGEGKFTMRFPTEKMSQEWSFL